MEILYIQNCFFLPAPPMPNESDISPRSNSDTNGSLYQFIQRVDQSFPVAVSRLASLPSTTRINFGALFIAHAVLIFWNSRSRFAQDQFEEFNDHLIDWITSLVECLLSDILCVTQDEATALKQVLLMSLPPYADVPPEQPNSDSLVTYLSSVHNASETDRDAFIAFLEEHACVSPLPLVVWLRDCVVLLILQSSETKRVYTTRTREVVFSVADSFSLDQDAIRMWERSIGEILHGSEHVSNTQATVSQSARRNQNIKIGLGAVGGAVLLGVTGGLAFPLLASLASGFGAALTGVGLGVIGTVFATTSLVLGSISVAGAVALFGITGGSLVTYKLSNRFGSLNVDDFKFKQIIRKSKTDDHAADALELILCVSGYLRSSRDYVEPWKDIRRRNNGLTDLFALQWEKKHLANLGSAFSKMLSAELASALTNAYLQITLGAVASTVALPITIISSMSDLDNILIVCENRAKQAGEAIADAICSPTLGARPCTLIAYSVGATAVFSCLEILAGAGQFSRIQNVIIMGATVPSTNLYEGQRINWQRARSVVSGRFINVYSKSDMLLHVLCRYLQWSIQVAGVSEVREQGIENFDVGDIIKSHSDYPAKISEVLTRVGYLH